MSFRCRLFAAAALLAGFGGSAEAQPPAPRPRPLPRIQPAPRAKLDARLPRYGLKVEPRFRLRAEPFRLRALNRSFARLDRMRERQFAFSERTWRRQLELRERTLDRMRERTLRARPLLLPRRVRTI